MKTAITRKTLGALCTALFVNLFTAWLPWISAHAQDDSVCARVKIEIRQELTLERQAFDAHMRISNGLTHIALEDVRVTVNFADEQRNPVIASSDRTHKTALFFIDLPSMENINNVDGSGAVAPATTADIHWLIIPTVGASKGAPQGTLYYVGATLTYTVGGEEHVTEVTPDYIYVKPLPTIVLDYFLPQDVYGDDAFTADIEPPVPFSLGVRVSNNGEGVAKKLMINSAQPKIVKDQGGLLIGFAIEGSEVNGSPATPSLLVDFGDIPPNGSAVARWIMTCSLSGRFVEFKADYTHSDELGGELTSLFEEPVTHFLVHDVLVDVPGRDRIRDFLAVGGADSYTVYESEKIDTPVFNQSGSSTLTGSGSRYTLTTPVTDGFMVVKLPDPNAGQKIIKEAIRSDGKRIKPENAWLSKTRDGSGPWQHFFYLFDANTPGSYTVHFGEAAAAHAPVLEFIQDRTGLEGESLSFVVRASDPDGTIPKLSAAPLPAGASFTEEGNGIGAFAWTPAEGQAGRYEITFTASDGALEDRKRAALTIRSLSDTDGDGMLDSWERMYFSTLDRDGQQDFDGDGVSDLDEFLQGKDPTKTNAPGTPEIFSPEDGTEVAEFQPELMVVNSVDPDGDSLTYDFELYSDEALSVLTASRSDVSETPQTTSWTVSEELSENAWYFWRVKATDGYGFSQWAYGSFFVNVENDPPGPFNISSPADQAEVTSTTPVLEVTNSTDPDQDVLTYSFEVYGNGGSAGPAVVSVTGVPEEVDGSTSWTVNTPLNDNTWYSWRAVATDEHGSSAETAVSSFFVNTANDAPEAPALLDPADGSEVAVQELDLTVTNATDVDGDLLTYFFELDKVNTFDSLAKASSGSVTEGLTATAWRVSGLEENTWYFWRVKASDGAAESPWAQGCFFVNTVNDAPATPTIKNPGNGSWVSTLAPTLELNPVADPDHDSISYRFEVYAESGLSDLLGSFETEAPSWIVAPALSDNTWYFWRALAADEHGAASEWTEAVSFFTDSNGVNDAPVVSLKEPAQPVTLREGAVFIQWEDADPDSNAVIALYYESLGTGRVLIVSNVEEDPDADGDTYSWNLSGLQEGSYTVCAEITDGSSTRSSCAPGMVTIDGTPPTAVASPPGGEYFSPQSVSLAADEPSELHYTTDGSEPAISSLHYEGPILISQATTLKFIAVDVVGNQSGVFVETYAVQDTDSDGMLDAWEMEHFKDLSKDGTGDGDNDGLSDLDESLKGTGPLNADTDEDGMEDGWEVAHQLDPLVKDQSEDPDEDGFTNGQESFAGTDPRDPDSRPLPPVADAGKDANVMTGQSVSLDGSNSYDPEGAMIRYEWSFAEVPQGSSVTDLSISDPAGPKPTFTPDIDGRYVVLLTVSDGMLSDEDQVVLAAATPNVTPNADAGSIQNVATGDQVTLDGTASNDPDGKPQPLTYLWSFDAVPEESELTDEDIANRNQAVAGFTPDVEGVYVLRLAVSDGEAASEDTVEINAVTENVAPIANAGPDRTVRLGQIAVLDGSASSDPDAGPSALTYQWRFVSVPAGSTLTNDRIVNSASAAPSFTPDRVGTYVVELCVSDGEESGCDNAAVTVLPALKPGDLDGDGKVSVKDLAILLASYGKCMGDPRYNPDCDYDRDGCVTLSDYRIWLRYYLEGIGFRLGLRIF